MIAAIVDTHCLIWYLLGDTRLSSNAREFIINVSAGDDYMGLSAITFVEIAYLVEKKRIDPTSYETISAEINSPTTLFKVIDVSIAIADSLRSIPRNEIPDMPDRIIAATALSLNVPVITRDRLISASTLQTIW